MTQQGDRNLFGNFAGTKDWYIDDLSEGYSIPLGLVIRVDITADHKVPVNREIKWFFRGIENFQIQPGRKRQIWIDDSVYN